MDGNDPFLESERKQFESILELVGNRTGQKLELLSIKWRHKKNNSNPEYEVKVCIWSQGGYVYRRRMREHQWLLHDDERFRQQVDMVILDVRLAQAAQWDGALLWRLWQRREMWTDADGNWMLAVINRIPPHKRGWGEPGRRTGEPQTRGR